MSQILVKGGNIWDGTKNPLQHNLDLLITDTKITTIGKNLEVKENIQVINAVGKTIITGLIVSYLQGYWLRALSLGLTDKVSSNELAIGIGMWLGIIMAYNVWMVIWPNQKKALGIIDASTEEKAKSAKTAMLFSRTNTLLSIPMLLSMVSAQNLF